MSEPYEIDADMLNLALETAIERGWLVYVQHGYCFHCCNEKPVYEVIMENAPVQPPRCADCYLEQGTAVMADPEARQRIENDARSYGAS